MLAVTLGLVLQSTPVTFESPGIRLVNLIPALSKAVGVPMRVAKHMENDVVAIRTAGRPWSEVKANLAKVLNGEWRETDGEFFLGQSEAQRQTERDSRRAYMLRVLERRFAALAKNYSPTAWTEAEFNRWYSGFVQKPDPELNAASKRLAIFAKRRSEPRGRLAARMLHQLRPADLIPDSLDWEMHAFSMDKFPSHQQLRLDCGEAFRMFLAEKQMYLDRTQNEEEQRNDLVVGATIQVWDEPRISTISFDFYDAKGLPQDFAFDFDRRDQLMVPQKPQFVQSLMELGKFAKQGWRSVFEATPERQNLLLRQASDYRNQLARCEIEDPLAMFGGADWVQLSKEQSLPMAAFLADENAEVPSIQANAMERGPVRLDSGGWMLGSHSDLYLSRRHRANRMLLRGVAQYALKSGRGGGWYGVQGILEQARLAWKTDQARLDWISGMDSLDFEFMQYVSGGAFAQFSAEEAAYFAPLIGAMSTDEQMRLVQSGRVSLANISPPAQEYFRSRIYMDGVLTAFLDDRVKGVGFANLHRDVVMECKVITEEGLILSSRTAGQVLVRDSFGLDEFASALFSGELKQRPEDVVVRRATQTQLHLTMRKQGKQVQSVLRSDWKPVGEPAKLSAATIADLKRRYDEVPREVPPTAVPV